MRISDLEERKLVGLAVAYRVWLISVAYLTWIIVGEFDASVSLSPTRSFLDLFARWDAVYFTHIAQEGYVYEQEYAFFPLFPMILNVISRYSSFKNVNK